MFGNEALEVTYVDGEGKASTQLLFRGNRSQDSDEGNVGTRGNSELSGGFETE
jgi:hypothetical protein